MKEKWVIFASVIVILGAITYSIQSPLPQTTFTEFYMLPDYTLNFTYAITSYEGKPTTYRVEGYYMDIETGGKVPIFDDTINLAHRDNITKKISMSSLIIGKSGNKSTKSGMVVLNLYRKDLSDSKPYRTLHFNVKFNGEESHVK